MILEDNWTPDPYKFLKRRSVFWGRSGDLTWESSGVSERVSTIDVPKRGTQVETVYFRHDGGLEVGRM